MGRRTARLREQQKEQDLGGRRRRTSWRPVATALVVVLVGIPLLVLGGGAFLAQLQSSATPPAAVGPSPLPSLAPVAGLPGQVPAMSIDLTKTYTAVFGTRYGPISVLLQPKWAPQTVNSFIYLASRHYWDGQYVFKRVSGSRADYLELGDRTSTGGGVGPYALPAETPPPGVTLSGGTVAMDYQPGQAYFESSNLVLFNIADNTTALTAPVGIYKPVHNVFGQVTSGMSFLQHLSRGDQIFTVRVTANP